MRFSHLAVVLPLIAGWCRAESSSGISKCGNKHVDHVAEQKTQQLIKLYGPTLATATADKVVPLYWHTITSSKGEGAVTSARIAQQVNVLNKDYTNAGFSFKLIGSDTTVQDTWFYNMTDDFSAEWRAMNKKLRKGGAGTLNLYTVQPQGFLGLAAMPSFYKQDPISDAVIVHHESLPGGKWGVQNSLGHTATHEVGHWLGLYHTFQGNSCDDPNGDYVADTPPQKTSTDGCPAAKDSCPNKPGADSIHNYME